ncbi:uncharacterized protein LOC128679275 isoform X2 [Plodia interpunctella]|uniref:uncharacterized protein LOC128679275 isoform X2 n=1 Tax=Plodia interpunctella TaxID=58824 RepID=UPI0023680144|nr:uncharacterized protein LOC128679275 isoform X2 [Plodia interpunctella]
MDVRIEPKFIPHVQEETLDTDDCCIFDGVKYMLMQLLSIELSIVFVTQDDLMDTSIMNEGPHIIFLDDILEDYMGESLISTVIPNTFVITRGFNNVRYGKDVYLPVYKVGNGKDSLELARWNVFVHREKIELMGRVSVLPVRSESDMDEARKSIKASSLYHQLILLANYPDFLELKKIVHDGRLHFDLNYTFVVFTNNTNVTDDMLTQKPRLRTDLVFTVLKDGIWGGEYYVPVKN